MVAKPHTLLSAFPPGECEQRIRGSVRFWPEGDVGELLGLVRDGRFTIWRGYARRNWVESRFAPYGALGVARVKGSLSPEAGGTRLEMRIGIVWLSVLVPMLPTLMFAMCLPAFFEPSNNPSQWPAVLSVGLVTVGAWAAFAWYALVASRRDAARTMAHVAGVICAQPADGWKAPRSSRSCSG